MVVTSIQVSEELLEELAERKDRAAPTYEAVIWRLIDRGGRGAAPRASSSAEAEERIRCEHCGHVWSTRSTAERPTCSQCTRKTDRIPADG